MGKTMGRRHKRAYGAFKRRIEHGTSRRARSWRNRDDRRLDAAIEALALDSASLAQRGPAVRCHAEQP